MWNFPRRIGIGIVLIILCVLLSWLVTVDPLISASKGSSRLPLSQHTTSVVRLSPTLPVPLVIATTPTVGPTPTAMVRSKAIVASRPIPTVGSTSTPVPTYGSTATPVPTATSTTVPGNFNPNVNYKLVNVNSGLDLEVTNSSAANGAQVIQFYDKGGNNQRWNIIAVGNVYKLVNVNSGLDLDVTNSSAANGAQIIQFYDKGGNNQRWNIIAIGNAYKLVNVNSGLDLEVTNSSTANGAQIIQFYDKGGSNQRWNIVQVS